MHPANGPSNYSGMDVRILEVGAETAEKSCRDTFRKLLSDEFMAGRDIIDSNGGIAASWKTFMGKVMDYSRQRTEFLQHQATLLCPIVGAPNQASQSAQSPTSGTIEPFLLSRHDASGISCANVVPSHDPVESRNLSGQSISTSLTETEHRREERTRNEIAGWRMQASHNHSVILAPSLASDMANDDIDESGRLQDPAVYPTQIGTPTYTAHGTSSRPSNSHHTCIGNSNEDASCQNDSRPLDLSSRKRRRRISKGQQLPQATIPNSKFSPDGVDVPELSRCKRYGLSHELQPWNDSSLLAQLFEDDEFNDRERRARRLVQRIGNGDHLLILRQLLHNRRAGGIIAPPLGPTTVIERYRRIVTRDRMILFEVLQQWYDHLRLYQGARHHLSRLSDSIFQVETPDLHRSPTAPRRGNPRKLNDSNITNYLMKTISQHNESGNITGQDGRQRFSNITKFAARLARFSDMFGETSISLALVVDLVEAEASRWRHHM